MLLLTAADAVQARQVGDVVDAVVVARYVLEYGLDGLRSGRIRATATTTTSNATDRSLERRIQVLVVVVAVSAVAAVHAGRRRRQIVVRRVVARYCASTRLIVAIDASRAAVHARQRVELDAFGHVLLFLLLLVLLLLLLRSGGLLRVLVAAGLACGGRLLTTAEQAAADDRTVGVAGGQEEASELARRRMRMLLLLLMMMMIVDRVRRGLRGRRLVDHLALERVPVELIDVEASALVAVYAARQVELEARVLVVLVEPVEIDLVLLLDERYRLRVGRRHAILRCRVVVGCRHQIGRLALCVLILISVWMIMIVMMMMLMMMLIVLVMMVMMRMNILLVVRRCVAGEEGLGVDRC